MATQDTKPPGIFLGFFRWFCDPQLRKYIEGDLLEFYHERLKASGKRKADLHFIGDVLLLFRPGIVRRMNGIYFVNYNAMFKNYLKVMIRNMVRHKGYAAINIIGFALGIAVSILIFLFVMHEKSFDNLHARNIYRVNEVQKFPGMVSSQKVALTMFPMGPTLKDDFPEIRSYTRINWTDRTQVYVGDKRFSLSQVFFVDSTFLHLFDFPLLAGDRKTALLNPNTIVLTRSAARKLFGEEDPLGQLVTYYGRDTLAFTVTGMLQDIPENSQLQFEALIPIKTIARPQWSDNWGGNWLNTYLELEPNTDVAALEKKFPDYLKRHMSAEGWKFYELFLLPLREVHGNSADIDLDYINYQKFDKKYTGIFLGIALVILLIACINFMNLSTARSAERAKEVGVRKSVGSHRWQLGIQFIVESILLSIIALIIAVVLVNLLLPEASLLSGRRLSFPVFSNLMIPAMLLLGTVVIGIISGLYPAVYLSAFRPARVLKGTLGSLGTTSRLRNILVIVQFASAIFLMVNTLFAVRQLQYMKSKDPGFDRDQVVDVVLHGNSDRKYQTMKKQLLSSSLVTGVTASQDILGSHLDQSGVKFKGDGPERELSTTRLIVDPDYLNLYRIKLVEGQNFSDDANGHEYIINEELAKELLSDSPAKPLSSLLGAQFGFDSLGVIVGIADNFNFNSLHNKIETMFMVNQTQWGFNHMSVKINGKRTDESLDLIKSVWDENCKDQPFDYQFLDDHFAEIYRSDARVSQVIGILTTMAFIISCLGLFGLASHSAERRVKEIGIRKVLGASVQSIVNMLSWDFLKYVLVAAVIALPLAWFAVNQWLQNYAYRIGISLWVFLGVLVTAVLIALLTTSFQAVRTATMNPATSLKSE